MTKRTFLGFLLGSTGILTAVSRSRISPVEPPLEMASSPVTVRLMDAEDSLLAPISVPSVVKSDAAWRIQLSAEQFNVTRGHGTERPFCGSFTDNHRRGVYTCVGCGLPLFRSAAKFDSGTGWPSFATPIAAENIGATRDVSFGMARTEIHCARCSAHLGHVFEDGPAPDGTRYCLNSVALDFREKGLKPQLERVLFGAGCFWGVEDAFMGIKGVTRTGVGYAGGFTKSPTYSDVCAHNTGHAEVVEVEYDPAQVSFAALLGVFWKSHRPPTGNWQRRDTTGQYRSAIFFTTPAQEAEARLSAARLGEKSGESEVTTEITLASDFTRAEEYHQKFHVKHGGSCKAR